jgi:hypothetical protein
MSDFVNVGGEVGEKYGDLCLMSPDDPFAGPSMVGAFATSPPWDIYGAWGGMVDAMEHDLGLKPKPSRGQELATKHITYDGNWVNFDFGDTQENFGIGVDHPKSTAIAIRTAVTALIDAAIAEERERCAKIAHFWTTDEGRSPLHGEALVHGYKMAGNAIEQAIRRS